MYFFYPNHTTIIIILPLLGLMSSYIKGHKGIRKRRLVKQSITAIVPIAIQPSLCKQRIAYNTSCIRAVNEVIL